MTVVELFMVLNGLVGAVAGFRGGFDHAWYWTILTTPLGLVAGVVSTLPVVIVTGLMAFALLPLDEKLRKDWPRLYDAFETVTGIALIMLAILVPVGIYILIHGAIDRLLSLMGL